VVTVGRIVGRVALVGRIVGRVVTVGRIVGRVVTVGRIVGRVVTVGRSVGLVLRVVRAVEVVLRSAVSSPWPSSVPQSFVLVVDHGSRRRRCNRPRGSARPGSTKGRCEISPERPPSGPVASGRPVTRLDDVRRANSIP
jgi:hypothetical protein